MYIILNANFFFKKKLLKSYQYNEKDTVNYIVHGRLVYIPVTKKGFGLVSTIFFLYYMRSALAMKHHVIVS